MVFCERSNDVILIKEIPFPVRQAGHRKKGRRRKSKRKKRKDGKKRRFISHQLQNLSLIRRRMEKTKRLKIEDEHTRLYMDESEKDVTKWSIICCI